MVILMYCKMVYYMTKVYIVKYNYYADAVNSMLYTE